MNHIVVEQMLGRAMHPWAITEKLQSPSLWIFQTHKLLKLLKTLCYKIFTRFLIIEFMEAQTPCSLVVPRCRILMMNLLLSMDCIL